MRADATRAAVLPHALQKRRQTAHRRPPRTATTWPRHSREASLVAGSREEVGVAAPCCYRSLWQSAHIDADDSLGNGGRVAMWTRTRGCTSYEQLEARSSIQETRTLLTRAAWWRGMLTRQALPCTPRSAACRCRATHRRLAAPPPSRGTPARAAMTSVTQLDPACPAEPLPGVSREVRVPRVAVPLWRRR